MLPISSHRLLHSIFNLSWMRGEGRCLPVNLHSISPPWVTKCQSKWLNYLDRWSKAVSLCNRAVRSWWICLSQPGPSSQLAINSSMAESEFADSAFSNVTANCRHAVSYWHEIQTKKQSLLIKHIQELAKITYKFICFPSSLRWCKVGSVTNS